MTGADGWCDEIEGRYCDSGPAATSMAVGSPLCGGSTRESTDGGNWLDSSLWFEFMVEEAADSRYATARTLCYLGAFVIGGLGLTMLLRPVAINSVLPVIDLPRWWGVPGVIIGASLAYSGSRLGKIELAEDFEHELTEARTANEWMEVYRLTRREAAFWRQEGERMREREAREQLVDVAVEELEHGEYQALRQLTRLQALAPEEVGYVEQRIELLRDVGSLDRLSDALEQRLRQPFDDEEREFEIREELVEIAEERGEPARKFEHVEWILGRKTDADLLDRVANWTSRGVAPDRISEIFGAAADRTEDEEWRIELQERAAGIEDEKVDQEGDD